MTVLNFEFWAFVGVIAGIYTIFSLGLQIQFGFAGLLNFGHAAFMAIGAYTMAILVVKAGMNTLVASLIAIVTAVGFSILVGLTSLRLRAEYFAITTLAAAEIVRFVALNEEGLTGGAQGTIALAGAGEAAFYNAGWAGFQTRVAELLSPILGDDPNKDLVMLILVWSLAVALILLMQVAIHSPWGRVLRSIREDEDAAASLWKNVFGYKLQALAVGSALAAVAGLFFAFQFSFFSPGDFDSLTTFFAYVIVLLGGTARNWAVPVGAIVFGFIFAGARFFDFAPFTYFDSAERAYLRLIIIGLILIGLMAFRPQGLLGRREVILE
jgi:branched-chain amino acid transport system permease protein